jgi:hypothetical protein
MIRVVLPFHLQTLTGTCFEVELEVASPATLNAALNALEAAYPALRGTIRDIASGRRRPLLRFYACKRDLSNEDPESPLPAEVASGAEPLVILGAIAGG